MYTVKEVAALFPVEDPARKAHVAAVRAVIESIGCYRIFDEEIFLTDADVRDLMDGIRARGGVSSEPLDTELGHLVLIGPRVHDEGCLNFLGWARAGEVQKLITSVQTYATEKVDFLDAAACSYGEFKHHFESLQKYRERGYWHVAVPQFRAYLRQLFETNIGTADQEERE
jgi:hypothetical protein